MPRKILIADDSAINRQMLINTLCGEYDVIEAENGKEALALMQREYKLLSAVLLDIMMPVMDGYGVLRHARENAFLAQIPIIMVTGSEDEGARVKALSLGANDFILKPFNPDIVRHCVRNNIALRETASILNAIQKDKLTGLYNREAFFQMVNAAIRGAKPDGYILSCFDIDNFKLINDQYGVSEGDRILREIGNTIKLYMDGIGGIAGRISADNFAALFPVEYEDNYILQKIQNKKLVMLEQRSIVFSVGRYIISDTALAASAIYDRAYIAKQSVKGRYDKHLAYFDEAMLQKLVRDQQIVSEMEAALMLRQFEVWFQPQYNHVTGAITGAEVLVRWRHPQKGIIPPGEFIPLFEQNGFVYELDKFVWREAGRYLRKWIDEGSVPLPVSVNISRYDIFRADLIEVLTGIVGEFDIPIELLRLEITESAFAQSTTLIVDIVKQLINLGFTVEIDDFGSGYSSLNTLKSVPAQVVKLDMRFLEGEDDAQRGGNILESIVRMAKWLGMSVIAEGVETKEQGDFLKSIGCSHVQGYLYARPMPAGDYETCFKDGKKEDKLSVLETAEHLNNDMFWNPKSMDSLIFNSFVGSACIYESHNGKIELLRATDKYARMLGGESMTVDALLQLDLGKYIDKKTSEATFAKVEASVQGKEEVTGEFLFIDIPGCPHETYIRSTMRVIASTGDSYLVYCISENITAQRLSERKERRIAKQLQAIMDNINCGITAVTMRGDEAEYLLANDKYYELLGYTKEQYQKEASGDLYAVVYEEDRRRVAEIAKRTMLSGKPTSMEHRAVRRDGSVVWLRSFLSMTSFEDVEGPVQLCTYADITAEKHTAQNLLDNLPCGAGICVVTENDAHMTYLNKRYFTYFKHNIEMRSGASVFSVIHPDDHAMLRSTMRPAFKKGGEGSCVVRVADGDEYIYFRLSGVAIESDDNTNAIYVTFVPIAHEALSFSEMLPVVLEKMMASSTDLSFVKDKNLKYICCSHAFARMVELENEKDIVGKTDYDLFEKEFADQYSADDRALMASGKSIIDMVEAIPSENGRNRYSSTSKYLLYDSLGNVIGLYGTGHDITHLREAESQQKFLINSLPGGVAIYEGQWSTLESIKLTYFSDGFCRLFGYTREEYKKLGAKNATGLVSKEYLPGFVKQIETLIKEDIPIDYIYKALGKNGARWIHVKAVMGEKRGENLTVNAVFFDVTEHQEALERLRVSEEENRIALKHSGNVVCRYDVAARSLRIASSVNPIFEMGATAEDVPYGQVKHKRVSPETADDYTSFYESIIHGEKSGSVVYQRKSSLGWRWIKANSTTIFSSEGEPVSAVITFVDITEDFEKDAAYKKWIQSLHNKEPKAYTLLRCNISKKTVFDTAEGSLLSINLKPDSLGIGEHAKKYADRLVFSEDKERFLSFLDVDAMLEKYYRGERIIKLEYREKAHEDDYRWLRLTADLVEYPHSADVEAYLLFEDIDEAKRAELLTIERAETDALTGVFNRATFAEKVNELLGGTGKDEKHAVLMLDIDGFKLVNDAFGHGAGDQTLIEIANMLRTVLRRDDFVGRLGGDEFLVFLNNIPNERIAANKAKQMCELSRKSYSAEVQISGSVGIALYPQDGANFETLYKRADDTLYYVKSTGKDNFAFYHKDMYDEAYETEQESAKPAVSKVGEKKRRMLIVDDSRIDCELLANIFRSDFLIEKAKDGNEALIKLRHYGSAIAVVLLDLLMPGVDGFEVLEAMRQNPEMSDIPVIVVSGVDDREASLNAIRAGAFDFVMKPVDADVLRIRVRSAISRADNERLRAKNSLLEMQGAETLRYKMVLDKLGIAVAEMDWGKGTFSYSPSCSDYLAGKYDGRSLWHILLSDLVTDAGTVREIQQFVHDVADDRNRSEGSIEARLKIPSGGLHTFSITVYKLMDEYGLAKKLLLTFKDTKTEKSS